MLLPKGTIVKVEGREGGVSIRNPWFIYGLAGFVICRFMTKRKIGDVAKAKVVKILPSGAIVSFKEGDTAFLHISEISKKYVSSVKDVLKFNQEVEVEVIEVKGNKTFVSMKNMASEAEKKKEFEDKIQKFLELSSEKQRQIQKSNDKKRGYLKNNPKKQ